MLPSSAKTEQSTYTTQATTGRSAEATATTAAARHASGMLPSSAKTEQSTYTTQAHLLGWMQRAVVSMMASKTLFSSLQMLMEWAVGGPGFACGEEMGWISSEGTTKPSLGFSSVGTASSSITPHMTVVPPRDAVALPAVVPLEVPATTDSGRQTDQARPSGRRFLSRQLL